MLDIGFVAALTAIAAGLGLRVLRRLDAAPAHPGDALALSTLLGLGLLSLAALALGEVGWLGRPGFIGVLAAAAIVGGRDALAGIRRAAAVLPGPRDLGAVDALAGVALVGSFLTALTPVTDGDALCYHLQVPKVFLAAGSVGFEPDLHETIYPLATEMLYAAALAFRGPVACRLVQWVLGLAFAGVTTALARPALGDRARWAGALALLVPAVSNGMGAPLNDVALAAFGVAAILAWTAYLDRPTGRMAALAGAFAGLAIGVKYPALVLAGLVGLAILAGRRRGAFAHAAAFGAMAVAVGGCWYLRAYIHTGNPVFPFFRGVFGGAGLDEVLDPIKRPMDPTAWNLLTALGPLTLQPDRFDSLAHQFGPAFLLFLPALLLERAPRRVLSVVGLGYAFLLACLTQRQSMRFLLIAVGPMSVGVAWLAAGWADRRTVPARLLLGLLGLVMLAEAAQAAGRARHGIGVVLGRESPEAYLARREPTFPVGRWIDDHLPAGARLVGQDHRGFYLPRPYTMELAHRRRTGLGSAGETAGQMVATLRERGFTHLLLCPPEPEDAVEFDPTLQRRLAPWLAGREPLFRADLADGDGVVRAYAIYELDGPRLAAEGPEARR